MAIDYSKIASQYDEMKKQQEAKTARQNIEYSGDESIQGAPQSGGIFANLARGVARTPLKFAGSGYSALAATGQLLTGQKEKAAETIKYGSEKVRETEKALGYQQGEISSPYKAGVDVAEQKERGIFGRETLEMLGAGAELASYGIGAPSAKATWQAAKAGSAPLGKLAFGAAKREAVAGGVGAMGYEVQEEDASLGSVAGAGVLGTGLGFGFGFAMPFASKGFNKIKTFSKEADEAVNQAMKAQQKKTPVTRWDQVKPQTETPAIKQPLAEIDDDIFPVASPDATPVAEPIKKKAIKAGFKEWQVNLVSEMGADEKAMARELVSIAENKSQNILAKSPYEKAAEPVVNQVKHLQTVRKQSGQALDELVENMPNEAISLAEPMNAFDNWIADRGIKILTDKKTGRQMLSFRNSKFSTPASAKDRETIQIVFNELHPARAQGGISYRTPKEIRTSRQRLFKVLEKQKKSTDVFSPEIESLVTSVRQELNSPLASLSTEYATANKNYAIANSKLEGFMKFLGKDFYDAMDEDITARVGELLPRLISNVGAKPGVILKELAEGAVETGMAKEAVQDPRRLIHIAEMLNDLYDIKAPRGFQGSIERAGANVMEGAKLAADIATVNPVSATERAMKMFAGDPKLKQRQILKEMLGTDVLSKTNAAASAKTAKIPKGEAAGGVMGFEVETDASGKPTGKINFNKEKALAGMVGMTATKKIAPKLTSKGDDVLYHGTASKIDKFDNALMRGGNQGKGIYLSNNPSIAKYHSFGAKDRALEKELGRMPYASEKTAGEVLDVKVKPGANIKKLDHTPTAKEVDVLKKQGFDGVDFVDEVALEETFI